MFGLLGPNGAGKTTTVGMLTTRVRPTAGRAVVGGVDVAADPVRARSMLAVVPQRVEPRPLDLHPPQPHLPRRLPRRAGRPGRPRAPTSCWSSSGCWRAADVKPDLFSGGQAQRVMIARALMHEPQVLFLDEPTTGLDPAARLFVWDRLRELRDRGVTLFLTTHDMHEAAVLADRVGIMDHGKLLALDTPEALMRSLPGSATLELSVRAQNGDVPSPVVEALEGLTGVERVEAIHDDTPDDDAAERRLRLYVSGEASQLIAPTATLLADRGVALGGWSWARRRSRTCSST